MENAQQNSEKGVKILELMTSKRDSSELIRWGVGSLRNVWQFLRILDAIAVDGLGSITVDRFGNIHARSEHRESAKRTMQHLQTRVMEATNLAPADRAAIAARAAQIAAMLERQDELQRTPAAVLLDHSETVVKDGGARVLASELSEGDRVCCQRCDAHHDGSMATPSAVVVRSALGNLGYCCFNCSLMVWVVKAADVDGFQPAPGEVIELSADHSFFTKSSGPSQVEFDTPNRLVALDASVNFDVTSAVRKFLDAQRRQHRRSPASTRQMSPRILVISAGHAQTTECAQRYALRCYTQLVDDDDWSEYALDELAVSVEVLRRIPSAKREYSVVVIDNATRVRLHLDSGVAHERNADLLEAFYQIVQSACKVVVLQRRMTEADLEFYCSSCGVERRCDNAACRLPDAAFIRKLTRPREMVPARVVDDALTLFTALLQHYVKSYNPAAGRISKPTVVFCTRQAFAMFLIDRLCGVVTARYGNAAAARIRGIWAQNHTVEWNAAFMAAHESSATEVDVLIVTSVAQIGPSIETSFDACFDFIFCNALSYRESLQAVSRMRRIAQGRLRSGFTHMIFIEQSLEGPWVSKSTADCISTRQRRDIAARLVQVFNSYGASDPHRWLGPADHACDGAHDKFKLYEDEHGRDQFLKAATRLEMDDIDPYDHPYELRWALGRYMTVSLQGANLPEPHDLEDPAVECLPLALKKLDYQLMNTLYDAQFGSIVDSPDALLKVLQCDEGEKLRACAVLLDSIPGGIVNAQSIRAQLDTTYKFVGLCDRLLATRYGFIEGESLGAQYWPARVQRFQGDTNRSARELVDYLHHIAAPALLALNPCRYANYDNMIAVHEWPLDAAAIDGPETRREVVAILQNHRATLAAYMGGSCDLLLESVGVCAPKDAGTSLPASRRAPAPRKMSNRALINMLLEGVGISIDSHPDGGCCLNKESLVSLLCCARGLLDSNHFLGICHVCSLDVCSDADIWWNDADASRSSARLAAAFAARGRKRPSSVFDDDALSFPAPLR